MTITISDKAQAVAACQAEIDALMDKAVGISDRQAEIISYCRKELGILSNDHKIILNKIIAMQDTQQELLK